MSIALKLSRMASPFRGTGAMGAHAAIAASARGTYLSLARPMNTKAATANKAKASLTVTAASGISNDFSSSWSPMTTLDSTSGASASIVSNRGRLHTGTNGGYGDYIVEGFTPDANNYDFTVDMVVVTATGEHFQSILWRAQAGLITACYSVVLGVNQANEAYISVYEMPGFNVLGSEGGVSITTGTNCRFRIVASGTSHSIYWVVGGTTLPGTPNVTFSDATYTDGYICLAAQGGDANTAYDYDFDNFTSDVGAA